MESEVECIGKWMWGDVIGFVLEKKVRYTKVYEDSERANEDELIKEVIEEHQLQPSVAV